MQLERPVPVLLLTQSLGQGGTERQLAEIAKALNRSRFAVHVGCFRPEGFRNSELSREGIPILHLPVYSFRSPAAVRGAWTLGRYLRRHRIQVVHSFDTPMNCFAGPVARLFGVPVVLSSQRASRELVGGWKPVALRVTDRLVDGVVVNCAAVQRHMEEDERVRPERLYMCYNGLDTERFRPLSKQRPPALAGASLVVGVVAALRPEKGLPTLLEAFAKVVSNPSKPRPGLRLVVIGSGSMLETLQAMSIRLGLQDRCHFEPSTADVSTWLRAIDIFVLPSLSEALSNALMEAMACGCAVVASKVGGNPELVSDGTTGLLFPPGDASTLADRLERLIDDEDLRARVSDAAAALVRQRFSLEASAQRMEEIYEKHLARKTSG